MLSLKKMIVFFLLIVCLLQCASCEIQEGYEEVEIDLDKTLITDINYLNWYVHEFKIDASIDRKYFEWSDAVKDARKKASMGDVEMLRYELKLFGSDYLTRTSDEFEAEYFYVGDFSGNKPDGFGVLITKNGFVEYAGEFDEGYMSGKGMQYYVPDQYEYSSDAVKYSSVLSGDLKERLNYCKYMGEIENGLPQGNGISVIYPSIKAELEYKTNNHVSYVHSTITVGEFDEGVEDGKYRIYMLGYLYINADATSDGTGKMDIYYMASNQIEYSGEIKDGEYHGNGILYDRNGDIIYKGKWRYGDYD